MTTGRQHLRAPEATADIAADEDAALRAAQARQWYEDAPLRAWHWQRQQEEYALRNYDLISGSGSDVEEYIPTTASNAALLMAPRRFAKAVYAAAKEGAARKGPADNGTQDNCPGDLSVWGDEGTIVGMDRGFGFICPAAAKVNNSDLYFHKTNCKTKYKDLRVGNQVTFTVAYDYARKSTIATEVKCKSLPDSFEDLRFHVGTLSPDPSSSTELPRYPGYVDPPTELPSPPPPPGAKLSSIPVLPPACPLDCTACARAASQSMHALR